MQENIGNGIFVPRVEGKLVPPPTATSTKVPRPLTDAEKARLKAEGRLQQNLGDLFPEVAEQTDAKTRRTPAIKKTHTTSAWAKPVGTLGTPQHFGQSISHPTYGSGKRANGNGKKKKG